MDIKRGKPPAFVERELVVDVTREDVLSILTSYIKRRLNVETINLDEIEVVGDPDGRLESMTLSGIEMVPITWKENVVPPPVAPVNNEVVNEVVNNEEPAAPPAS